jgi:hypothetical protein
MNFLLPGPASAEAARELARGYVVGAPDYMPWPTEIRVNGHQITVRRPVDDSGCICLPWEVDGQGRMIITTATLSERHSNYQLPIELARGRVNILRNQAADWQMGGLNLSPDLASKIKAASLAFARAVCHQDAPTQAGSLAEVAIRQALATSDELVGTYIDQVFHTRQSRQGRLETAWSVGLNGGVPGPELTAQLRDTFNAVRIPFSWAAVEATEGDYQWEPYDALVGWAQANGFRILAGPLIDFSRAQMPAWLEAQGDLQSLANFMYDYVETALRRYNQVIRTWQLTAGSNCASVLSLAEDRLLWLTLQLLEMARQVDNDLALVVGIAQPWGEYLAWEERTYSPFVFADTLLRSKAQLTSFDVEVVMGVMPRGSYLRDQLELSRLLDLYALLGLPLRVTLGCPSASGADPQAPDFQVHPRGSGPEWSPDLQAAWAQKAVALATCKPYVEGVTWTHCTDADPHVFPHAGLVAADGTPKPLWYGLKHVRAEHLL